MMKRTMSGIATILAICAAVPVFAADYPGLRPAYPQDWGLGEEDPLRFETGVRYWYSIGQQEHTIGNFSQSIESKSSSGEAFVRIDDFSTRTYVEATGGYGIANGGSYQTNGGLNLDLKDVRLGYIGGDFGWLPLGNEAGALGFVAGYQYTNDSPDTGRTSFTTAKSSTDITWSNATGVWGVAGDSESNDFNVHALKLGFAGRFDAGAFDVTAEATATPYAWVTGTYGAFGPATIQNAVQTSMAGSATTISGFGYGAGGKVMIGFHPTENFTIRVGGRASYLQGQYDATYDRAVINHPTMNPDVEDPANPGTFIPADPQYSAPTLTKQTFIIDNNPFKMIRYGALLELSGRF